MEVAYGLAVLGALAFAVGLFTEPIRRFAGGELLLATALGVAVGPAGLGLLDPFAWSHEISEQEEKVQQSVKNLLQLPVFLLFGMLLPWRAWVGVGIGGLAFVSLLLLFRRLPIVLALEPVIEPLETWRDAAFVGWFGPIGVAAIYYALYAKQRTGEEIVWTVASLVVATSVVVHGLTAYPLSRWLGRREPPGTGEDAEEPGEDERAERNLA